VTSAVAAAAAPGPVLGVATLITWLITAGIGAYMLAAVLARGGLRHHGADRHGLPPAVLVGHFSLAVTGLVTWASYLATSLAALAWLAVGLLVLAIGLGVSTVTIWTPFPGPPAPGQASPRAGSAGTGPAAPAAPAAHDELAGPLSDDELASALADASRAGPLIEELLARILAEPPRARRRPSWQLRALIPVSHGIAAGATFLLAVLTAAGSR
jgi:hypothetical protein